MLKTAGRGAAAVAGVLGWGGGEGRRRRRLNGEEVVGSLVGLRASGERLPRRRLRIALAAGVEMETDGNGLRAARRLVEGSEGIGLVGWLRAESGSSELDCIDVGWLRRECAIGETSWSLRIACSGADIGK